MGRACCVLGCPSGGDVPSHQIPKDPALFQKWKNMIYSEKIQHMTDEQISKCTVCYRHFSENDYLATFRVRKLKRGIAPSLNLPNKCSNNGPIIVKVESIAKSEISDRSASTTRTEMTNSSCHQDVVTGESEATEIALSKDLPEEVEPCLPKQSQQILSNLEKITSTAETFKLYCRERALRRKRSKLTVRQLTLLQCKKQAEHYKKTSTIQRLLSSLPLAEKASIETRIQKSKYSPKTYVRLYYDIAKKRALGEL